MARAVREHGGSVKDFTGDGIMVLFAVPEALEDGPLRACRAGLAIHQQFAAIEAKYSVRPRMRIGVNSGLTVVTLIQGESGPATAVGDTVNLASRLHMLAKPRTVYLSERTQRLVQVLVRLLSQARTRSRARLRRRKSIGWKRSAGVRRDLTRRWTGASAPISGASARWKLSSARERVTPRDAWLPSCLKPVACGLLRRRPPETEFLVARAIRIDQGRPSLVRAFRQTGLDAPHMRRTSGTR
jgi:Adenylate and Guanylate cyclase catalytic domain